MENMNLSYFELPNNEVPAHIRPLQNEELRSTVNLPEKCRIYRINELSCTIITDIETDTKNVNYDPVMNFIFYKPLPTNLNYYLCFYDWVGSEHIMLLDKKRKIAINVVYLFYLNNKNLDSVKVNNYVNSSISLRNSMKTDDDSIDWYRIGFGYSHIFQNKEGLLGRVISDPFQSKMMGNWFYKDLADYLAIIYYMGMPPLNPELLLIKPTDNPNENKLTQVNEKFIGRYDYSSDLYAPMNAYRQSLFDTFASCGVVPTPDNRNLMKETFCLRCKMINENKHSFTDVFQKGLNTSKYINKDALEILAKRLSQNPDNIFDALFPLTLMYKPTVVNRDLKVMTDIYGKPENEGFYKSLFSKIFNKNKKERLTTFVKNGPAETVQKIYKAMFDGDKDTFSFLINDDTYWKSYINKLPSEMQSLFSNLGLNDIKAMKDGFLNSNTFSQKEYRENFNPKNYNIEKEMISNDYAEVIIQQYNVFNGKLMTVIEKLILTTDGWKIKESH